MNTVKVTEGSIEFLYADIRTDRVLDTQAVSISISNTGDPGAWVVAEWVGAPGMFRSARILLDGTLAEGNYDVYARINDAPEVPIFHVGKLKIT